MTEIYVPTQNTFEPSKGNSNGGLLARITNHAFDIDVAKTGQLLEVDYITDIFGVSLSVLEPIIEYVNN